MSNLQRFTLHTFAALIGVAIMSTFVTGLRGPQLADAYSGTVIRDTATSHGFTVQHDGDVTVTLTRLALPTKAIGLGLGTPTPAGNCLLSEVNDGANVSTAIDERVTRGEYCVSVYDSGAIDTEEAVAYTVSVVLP